MRTQLKLFLEEIDWKENVPDVRHLLPANSVLDLRSTLSTETALGLSASGHFIPERVDELAKWFIEAATIDELIQAGLPADHEKKRLLHLGAGMVLGSKFADCIEPGHGGSAIRYAEALFSNMQKRFRCLLLRESAARISPDTIMPECRIAPDGDTACNEVWEASSKGFLLSEIPTLPLPACSAKVCNCGIDWLRFSFE
ncbi:MAG: hypothetical protein GC188_02200 [Alphaproteobacteria bacterium]|nr:hypothetical protein [Alphaproteobacteria bacterium]